MPTNKIGLWYFVNTTNIQVLEAIDDVTICPIISISTLKRPNDQILFYSLSDSFTVS